MFESIFNGPYMDEEETEATWSETKRKDKMKDTPMNNSLAELIFQDVLQELEAGKEGMTKDEMIALVAGDRDLDNGEKYVYNKAFNAARDKINRYYWSDVNEVTDKRLFSFVEDGYYLVNTDDDRKVFIINNELQKKRSGIRKKQAQIAKSDYGPALEKGKEDAKRRLEEAKKKEEAETKN